MTSFSPERARSWSFGIVTRVAFSFCWTLMVASSPVEELAPAAHGVDAFDQKVEMLGHAGEIELLAVDDQHGAVAVIVEVSRIRLRQAPQVVLVDAALDGIAALLHPRDEGIHRRLEIDHEVGHRRLRLHVL